MSEEVQNVQLTIEQILAAVLNKVGAVDLTETELLDDYSNYVVAVDPVDEKTMRFQLVDAGAIEDEQ